MTRVAFDDILPVVDAFPDRDERAESAAASQLLVTLPRGRDRQRGALVWMSGWQGRFPPSADRPRLCLFAGVHGVADDGTAAERLRRRIAAIGEAGAEVHALCAALDADLRVYEMAVDRPSSDFRQGDALAEDACARAIAYGMMAVDEGIDLLGLGTLSIGGSQAAAALLDALRNGGKEPLAQLRRFGGEDLAGVLGALIAARMARVPVVLEGLGALGAAAVLDRLAPGGAGHVRAAAPAGIRELDRRFAPLLDIAEGGEGAQAARAVRWLRQAIDKVRA